MFVKFAELPVFDQDRAIAFYTEKLSLTVAADVPYGLGDWRWVELALPGARTHLHFIRRPDEKPSDLPILVLVAEDLEATVERLRSNGAEIITEPQTAPWDRDTLYAEFRDSEGNRIVVNQE
ncbi:VOC family protein [Nitratireductor sp. GCM10026969]|uniref:VOC family protein n=1 Tax=Nitratireductor sp. GCM10026969 TaxID=3252645 RepID=UPI00361FF121